MHDERRTTIGIDLEDLSDEDLIPRRDTVVTITNLGYIKRMTTDNFKAQNRGGKGIKGMNTIDNDFIKKFIYDKYSPLYYVLYKYRTSIQIKML